ncbi:hypothetical protein ElyMa_003991700 [Elysia marginata]|uniref:Uncharacterized protein n=1 Tax=Elysia marginata TaxID=1093978 RepID=A0AAV4FYY4_9GAST|nr:hypothetical protein ElyMa_003991700 [Elysia marginata]
MKAASYCDDSLMNRTHRHVHRNDIIDAMITTKIVWYLLAAAAVISPSAVSKEKEKTNEQRNNNSNSYKRRLLTGDASGLYHNKIATTNEQCS